MINTIAQSASIITQTHPAAKSAGDSDFELELSSGTGAIFGKYKDASES